MWIIVLLPVLCVAGFFVYTKIIVPQMTEKSEAKQKTFTDSFISEIRGRETEVKSQYAITNGLILFIAKQMNGDTIEGVISCMEKRDLKDFARQALTNAAGNVIGKLTGIGFEQTDNEESYYLALSPDRLHYFHFSENGQCKEHLTFERNRMENLASGKITATEAAAAGGSMFEAARLGFMYDGTEHKFFYYDKFYGHPSVKEAADADKEFAAVNYLFAEPFLKFAATVRRES
jgi:hypothetical protein